jgi:hypothetical protein
MSGGTLAAMLSNMDGDMANSILEALDQDAIESALKKGIDKEVVPHLEQVRERAVEDDADAAEVRAHYESLDEDVQTERFTEAAADLMAVFAETRESPVTGATKLKGRLRDPWTVEALLLIFDHKQVPDEVVDQQKNYAATWMKWVGVNAIPEIYTREQVRDVANRLYPNRDPDAVLDEMGIDK